MYPCQVFADQYTVEILSVRTLNSRTLHVGNIPGGWASNFFSTSEKDFVDYLITRAGQEIQLSRESMQRFAGLCDRATAFDLAAQTAGKEIKDKEVMNPDVEAKLRAQEREMKELSRRANDHTQLRQFVYYVPVRVSNPPSRGGRGMFADNATRMYAFGVHFDGSTWTVKDGHLPTELMADMDDWNARPEVQEDKGLQVRYRLLKYHPDELAAFRAEAYDRLREHVCSLQTSLLSAIDTAAANLAEVEEGWMRLETPVTDDERRAAQCKRNDKVGGALCTARRELEKAVKVAAIFDETEAIADLVSAVRASIRAHEASLVALRHALKASKAK